MFGEKYLPDKNIKFRIPPTSVKITLGISFAKRPPSIFENKPIYISLFLNYLIYKKTLYPNQKIIMLGEGRH